MPKQKISPVAIAGPSVEFLDLKYVPWTIPRDSSGHSKLQAIGASWVVALEKLDQPLFVNPESFESLKSLTHTSGLG